jgi:Putative bacterial sensory transduction regulator
MTVSEGMAMTDELIATITPAALAEHLKNAGYRAAIQEQSGQVFLTSACQGVGFLARFGNPAEGQGGAFLDFSLSATLQMMGDPMPALAASWNQTRRFGRASLQGRFLVMEMDVTVAGGVTARHLRAQMELWDRLVQELLFHIRNGIAASQSAATPGEGGTTPAQDSVPEAA